MEDIQNLTNAERHSTAEKKDDRDRIKVLMDKLKERISNEKITPNKQHIAADKFFRAMGRGCQWGTTSTYDDKSVDARLLGCACCGMKDYNDTDESEIKREYKYLPLSKLDILELNNDDTRTYVNQITMKPLYLPVNEEGHLEALSSWKVKSVSSFKDLLDSEGDCFFYHLHPELVLTPPEIYGSEPVAVLCPDCADSIKNKFQIMSLPMELILDLAVE